MGYGDRILNTTAGIAVAGNPADVHARRFDAAGNPIGNDFVVNTTTEDAQGQPDVAVGPNGETVIVWAGDPLPGGDQLDIFAQVHDAAGNPIGGEIEVNSNRTGQQDQPQVVFLPELDSAGRANFVIAWRDVVGAADATPNGTGLSHKVFAIVPDVAIFTDGFESGDTSSWSSKVEN